MKKITGVTINYNSEEETIACLASLAKVNFTNIDFSFIVVDNNSKKESTESLSEHLKENNYPFFIDFIKNENNVGFSGGNNIGIKKALENGAELLLVLNNDTVVHPDLLHELIKGLEEKEHIGIVTPKIYFFKGSEFHKDRYDKKDLGNVLWYAGGVLDMDNVYGTHRGVDAVDIGQFDTAIKTDFATGCCMLVKKEVFEKIGYFDEDFFLYYEDIDFCMRVKKAGFAIVYIPDAILWHKNAGSTGGSGSNLQDYFMSRNRLLFGFRYASVRTKVALIRESVKNLIVGRHWQKIGIRDFFIYRLGKGSYNA